MTDINKSPRQGEIGGQESTEYGSMDLTGAIVNRTPLEFADTEQPLDPFDPKNLVVAPDYQALVGKPLLMRLRIGKPSQDQFFRVRPGEEHCLKGVAILHFNPTGDREGGRYLVLGGVVPQLRAVPKIAAHIRISNLYQCVTRYGAPFLWDIPQDDGSPRFAECHKVSEHTANLAKTGWYNITWNKLTKNYDVTPGLFDVEPVWLEEPLRAQLEAAFGKDGVIDTVDHPVIQQLLGRV